MITKNTFLIILIILMISCSCKEKKELETTLEEELVQINFYNTLIEQKEQNFSETFETRNDSFNSQNQYIIKDSFYENYQYNFEPLKEDEILIYSYSYGSLGEKYQFNNEEYMFRLSAKDTNTNEERVIGYWNVAWGNCQISFDKKSCLFFLNLQKRNRPLFKVDGLNGNVNYLMDTNLSARSTYDLSYLLFNFDDRGLFILVDLNKIEYIRSIEWRKEKGLWGEVGSRIFRSLDPKFDFRIDFDMEGPLIILTAYYSIEHDKLEVIFDITDSTLLNDAREREKILPEELGY